MYDLQSSFGQFKEALSSGRPKVTIGLVSIAVVLTVLCGVSGGLLSVFGFQATNILHGYAGVPFFWTLLTFNFFESDWWMLFLSLPVLLLCPLLEEHYGFVSVAKLILAVGSINGVVLFFWRILHWSIFQAEAPFFSPVGSCACVAVSVLIGVRQVSGQSCVRLMGGLEIPVQPRFLPLLLLCVVCVLCVVGVTGDFSLVSAIVGMVGG
uniref:Peptidase S54 rhomboid domain-containing protein n=1 Tax=Chromera velia CCMP2878 TaxID=1169474 RepID=A0A0G4HKD1_9ALVE|eukprot:Cvel_1119.t1-p1 / transcript=Cvel_1119.t1 / gene=Cvel_1119 / organism=Chromera_velia_CCMP2878 / gene_product=hypothetical protein / transcript_product=hypothetical protein / location=Cvel_scaffold36:157573-159290(-) / protein_length=208 / sequence_SO=supercontig / SO=protein_coding / is_pseudo=false